MDRSRHEISAMRVPPAPIYTPACVRPVHNLHYDWTGWLAGGDAGRSLVAGGDAREGRLAVAFAACREAWGKEGMELVSWRFEAGGRVQALFRVAPEVCPVFFTQRVKGRLDHALRRGVGRGGGGGGRDNRGSTGASPVEAGADAQRPVEAGSPFLPATGLVPVGARCEGPTCRFRRNVAFRSLGDNTRETVERYIARQAAKSNYVDPRYKRFLGEFTVDNPQALLANPYAGGHGRYWYNLHIVLVVQDRRWPITRNENFDKIRRVCFLIAEKKGHAPAAVSVMPDHLHIALRGNVEHSPSEIALGYLNNLAYVLGYNRCWSEEFYVGTFSEYGLGAVSSSAGR